MPVCDECDRFFKKKSHLYEHKKTHDSIVEKLLCPINGCGQTSSQIRNMRVHFKRYHKDETLDESQILKVFVDRSIKVAVGNSGMQCDSKKQKCKKCDRLFAKKSHVDEHLKTHNAIVEKLKCPVSGCGQTISQIRNMRVHFKRSHPDVPFDETELQKVSARNTRQLIQTADSLKISAARTRPLIERDFKTLVLRYTLFPKSNRKNIIKSKEYRHMKSEWPKNVYLARSGIHGIGVYAARDLEKDTMIIEYVGQVIRSELANVRDKNYEVENRGIYMFRLDEDRVIDATSSGGLARYINHSCDENCYAERIEVEGRSHIMIFAKVQIKRGQELVYDYKLELEDDSPKIQCLCNAPNCRKWIT